MAPSVKQPKLNSCRRTRCRSWCCEKRLVTIRDYTTGRMPPGGGRVCAAHLSQGQAFSLHKGARRVKSAMTNLCFCDQRVDISIAGISQVRIRPAMYKCKVPADALACFRLLRLAQSVSTQRNSSKSENAASAHRKTWVKVHQHGVLRDFEPE